MAYCTHCGTQVADGVAACTNCGHPQLLQPQPPFALQARRTEGLAITSLILGVAGLIMCPLVPSILAIIFGKQAREKIRMDPGLEGDGMAKAGVVLGWVGVGLATLLLVGAVLLVVFAASGADIGPVIDVDRIGG